MERARRGKGVMMINHMDPPKRCPRCESTDTKFCYFNNYSQTQPRHFCRACRRYWTDGGTLRNVPHGGGSYRRGNKRPRRAVTAPTGTTPRPVPSTVPQVMAPMAPPLPPPQQPFFFGGDMGSEGMMATVFQPFRPGYPATVADFGGFPAGDNQAPFNQQLLPGFYNLATQPPLPLQPPFDPAVSSAGTTVNGEGYWNEFNSVRAEEGSASRPPTPSASV